MGAVNPVVVATKKHLAWLWQINPFLADFNVPACVWEWVCVLLSHFVVLFAYVLWCFAWVLLPRTAWTTGMGCFYSCAPPECNQNLWYSEVLKVVMVDIIFDHIMTPYCLFMSLVPFITCVLKMLKIKREECFFLVWSLVFAKKHTHQSRWKHNWNTLRKIQVENENVSVRMTTDCYNRRTPVLMEA